MTTDGTTRFRYDVFLSYKHEDGGDAAVALKNGLERIARPWYGRRTLRVFLDRTNLDATEDGWKRIEEALTASRYMVLVATPKAATSPWVEREVRAWRRLGRERTLLLAHADGTLAWRGDAPPSSGEAAGAEGPPASGPGRIGTWDWERTNALPRALEGAFRAEPIWVDLTQTRDPGRRSLRDPAFKSAVAKLAAPIRGSSLDDLLSEDARIHRKAVRIAWGVALLVAALGAVAAWLLVRTRAAETNAATANEDRRRQAALASLADAEASATRGRATEALALTGRAAAEARDVVPTALLLRRWLETGHADWEAPSAFVGLSLPLAFAESGRVAIAPSGAGLSAYDVRDGRLLGVLALAGPPITAFAASRTGRHVALARGDGTVSLYTLSDLRHPLVTWTTDAEALAVSDDGSAVAWMSTGSVGLGRVGGGARDLDTSALLPWGGAEGEGTILLFAGDGRTLTAVGNDGTFARWDLRKDTLDVEADAPEETGAAAGGMRGLLGAAPDGARVVRLDAAGRLFVLEREATAWRAVPDDGTGRPAHRAWACLVVTGEGHTAVLATQEGTLVEVNLSTGAQRSIRTGGDGLGTGLPSLGGWLTGLTRLPSGALGLVRGVAHPWIESVDPGSGERTVRNRGTDAPVTALGGAPDGGALLCGDAAGWIRVLDPGTGEERRAVSAHQGAVLAAVVLGDGRRIATVGEDGRLVVRALDDLHIVSERRVPEGRAFAAAFSPDAGHAAVATWTAKRDVPLAAFTPSNVHVFSMADEMPAEHANGPTMAPTDVAVSSGGHRVFVVSAVGEVTSFELGTHVSHAERIQSPRASPSLRTFERQGYRLALAPQGDVVYVGDEGGRVLALRADDLKVVREVRAFPGQIGALAVSDDGLRLLVGVGGESLGPGTAVGERTSTLQVLEARSLSRLADLEGPAAGFGLLRFTPRGDGYVGATLDRRVRGGSLAAGGRLGLPIRRSSMALASEVKAILGAGQVATEELLREGAVWPRGGGTAPHRRLRLFDPRTGAADTLAVPVGTPAESRTFREFVSDDRGMQIVARASTDWTPLTVDGAATALPPLDAPFRDREGLLRVRRLAFDSSGNRLLAEASKVRRGGRVLLRIESASARVDAWPLPKAVTHAAWAGSGESALALDEEGRMFRIDGSGSRPIGVVEAAASVEGLWCDRDAQVMLLDRGGGRHQAYRTSPWTPGASFTVRGVEPAVRLTPSGSHALLVDRLFGVHVVRLADGRVLVDLAAADPGHPIRPWVDPSALTAVLAPFSAEDRVDRYELEDAVAAAELLDAASPEALRRFSEEAPYLATRLALDRVAAVPLVTAKGEATGPPARAPVGFEPLPEPSPLTLRVAAAVAATRARRERERDATAAPGSPTPDPREELRDLLTRLATGEGSLDDRLRWADRAIELDPRSAPAWNALGYARLALARARSATPGGGAPPWQPVAEQSLEAYLRAGEVAATPVETAGALQGQAWALQALGRPEEQLDRLRAARKLGMDLLPASTWQSLAVLLGQLSEYAEAAEVAAGAVAALGDAAKSLGMDRMAASYGHCARAQATAPRLPIPVIVFVAPGSAAERAGLAPGDVLVSIDGHAGESSGADARRFQALFTAPAAAPTARFEVARGSQTLTVGVPLPLAGVESVLVQGPTRVALVVQSVAPGSTADRIGARAGDLLVDVDGAWPGSLHELTALLAPREGTAAHAVTFRRYAGTQESGMELRRNPDGTLWKGPDGHPGWAFTEVRGSAPAGAPLGIVAVPNPMSEPRRR